MTLEYGTGMLDNGDGLELNERMPTHRVPGESKHLAVLKQQLAALQKRSAILWGELAAQEQEYVERMLSRAPTAAAFRQYESLRDRYWALETKRVQLRGMIAARMAAGDDLP